MLEPSKHFFDLVPLPNFFCPRPRLNIWPHFRQVCRHLERLYEQTVTNERTGEAQITRLMSLGRDLVEHTMPVLLCSLPAPGFEGEVPGLGALVAGEGTAVAAALDQQTQRGSLLSALLQQGHFRAGASEECADRDGGNAGRSFSSVLQEVQSSWQFAVPASSGLLDAFAGEQEVQVRQAYLDVCSHLDKFCFFLSALRPYQRLAAAGGDAALCWLRRSLGHLLQELDKSLLQLRQASLALMQAAKKQLQDLAKRLPSATDVEVQWMKQLRFVDEPRLSELHRACAEQAAQVSSLTSAAREVELKLAAKEGLQQIASAFLSADFQARCSLALPDRLALDMRELAGRTPAAISN
ncbi:unnamed protein product [Effrenium voratum]|nr:unnamed protein product [Effrenium voratum]